MLRYRARPAEVQSAACLRRTAPIPIPIRLTRTSSLHLSRRCVTISKIGRPHFERVRTCRAVASRSANGWAKERASPSSGSRTWRFTSRSCTSWRQSKRRWSGSPRGRTGSATCVGLRSLPSDSRPSRGRQPACRARSGLLTVPAIVHRCTELPLQFDEVMRRWELRQRASDLEDLAQLAVAFCVVAGQRGGLVRIAAQDETQRGGEQVGIAKRIADAVAWVRHTDHPADRRRASGVGGDPIGQLRCGGAQHRVERGIDCVVRAAEAQCVVRWGADPDARLAVVRRKDTGEQPLAEVVLHRRPVTRVVGVVTSAANAAQLGDRSEALTQQRAAADVTPILVRAKSGRLNLPRVGSPVCLTKP